LTVDIYLIARQLQRDDDETVPQRMYDAIGADDVRRIVEPHAALDAWVEEVRAELERREVPPHSVRSLKIAAHGTSGYIGLGAGLTFDLVWRLFPLARYVAPAASFHRTVVLNGCNVASTWTRPERFMDGTPTGLVQGDMCDGWSTPAITSAEGYHLLLNFARLFHGAAVAGIDSQPGGTQWDLRGPTLTVRPDGSYQLFGFDVNDCMRRQLSPH
jgi:hypothetical protein